MNEEPNPMAETDGDRPTCRYSTPGRGDCLHFIGLPDAFDETTTDHYGKPNDWCWWCWGSYQRGVLEARLAALATRLNTPIAELIDVADVDIENVNLRQRLAATTAALEAAQLRGDNFRDALINCQRSKIILRQQIEQESSAHRATTRKLEGVKQSLADYDAIITRYDADLKAARADADRHETNWRTELQNKEALYWGNHANEIKVSRLERALAAETATLDRLCELAKGVRAEGDGDMVATFERVLKLRDCGADHKSGEDCRLPNKHEDCAGGCIHALMRIIERTAQERENALQPAASVGQAVKSACIESIARWHLGMASLVDSEVRIDAIIEAMNQPLVASGTEGDEANGTTRNS